VLGGAADGSNDAIRDDSVGEAVEPANTSALFEAIVRLLEKGRTDPAAIEPYRRPHFAATTRLIIASLMRDAHQRREES